MFYESQGSSGAHIITLQAILNLVNNAGLNTDGFYGPRTADAVKAFQARPDVSLPQNGAIDPGVWGHMERLSGLRVVSIVNAEEPLYWNRNAPRIRVNRR